MDSSSGEQPDKELGSIESLVNKISQFGVVIMGIIGIFWFTLPYNPGSDKYKGLINFTRFIVAIIVVLIVYLKKRSRNRQAEARFWGKVAAVSLVASIVAFFGYYMIFENWTVKHDEKVLVIGYQVKEDVQEFVAKNPGMSPYELLSNAAWSPWKIWTAESIRRVRILLSVLYVLCAPFFAITLIAVAKVMSCAGSKE
jgi:hypothetical protein